MTGRYDEMLRVSLDKVDALRVQEAEAWFELKNSERAMQLLADKWEDSCSAIRRELDHQQAMEFLLQLEVNQKPVEAT